MLKSMKEKWNNGKAAIIIKLLLCIVLVISLFFGIRHVLRLHQYEEESEMIPAETTDFPKNEYDWSKLKWNGDLLSYEDDHYTSLQGIDVSSHQEEIDWKKVKQAGIDFAIIRVGYRGYEYGYLNDDYYFEENIKGAIENGISVGVYFFSQATTIQEAGEEAQYVIDKIKGYKIDLPVVFDMEEAGADGHSGRAAALDKIQKTQMAVTFLRHVENAGYTPMIYNSTTLFQKYFDLSYLQDFEFWVAEYDDVAGYDYQFRIWQYSSSGSVDGIDTRCDMDIMFVPKDTSAEKKSN